MGFIENETLLKIYKYMILNQLKQYDRLATYFVKFTSPYLDQSRSFETSVLYMVDIFRLESMII